MSNPNEADNTRGKGEGGNSAALPKAILLVRKKARKKLLHCFKNFRRLCLVKRKVCRSCKRAWIETRGKRENIRARWRNGKTHWGMKSPVSECPWRGGRNSGCRITSSYPLLGFLKASGFTKSRSLLFWGCSSFWLERLNGIEKVARSTRVISTRIRGRSSSSRADALQASGRGCKSLRLHQTKEDFDARQFLSTGQRGC